MKVTTKRRAVVLVTAGALGLGGLAAASPALAGTGIFHTGKAAVTQQGGPGGNGYGVGSRMGAGMGTGMRDGTCLNLDVTAAQGTLSDQQKSTLAAMAQEEKLAHDVYAAFAGKYPLPIFDRIATAETRHLATVRTLLERYAVGDPTAGVAAGTFSDPATQATYDRLLARGAISQSAALQVGQEVERTDIADLRKALTGLTAPDATQAYQHLLADSQQHLAAFTTWATR
ncbi:ferritin-like domain-containing protein [Paractinoplanes durhamensis]|uniref:DUF2202 domain-containing protein n=1 Tax=Paractinoplanes durhamensis TaxID=113563 RepID=A0ABQ3Z6N4_9ACTN|nr:DUF2202 domain-containing protein [Actinoplanes durhamensis]GIE05486.1 hypothetical protein Adu01nite_68360 [Actinoplanes durhamensis]